MFKFCRSALTGLLVGCATLLLTIPAFAGKPTTTVPVAEVLSVSIDFQASQIDIVGKNFDAGTPPLVYLAGVELPVLSYTALEIIAELPVDTPSGDYLLQIAPGGSAKAMAKYDLTIGAVGPQGPPGINLVALSGNDQLLGILQGRPTVGTLLIYVPAVNAFVKLAEADGSISDDAEAFFSEPNCNGTIYLAANSSIVKCGLNTYCRGADQPVVNNPAVASYYDNGMCGEAGPSIFYGYVGKVVTLPFTSPVVLPIKISTAP